VKSAVVYIMTNKPSGTLYIGVTSNLAARVCQHRNGNGSDFCKRYGLEPHDRITNAIAREKTLKAWQRAWKLNLIAKANPKWEDLYLSLNA
jgi:putative endonuclease